MAPSRIVERGELLAEVEQEYLGRSRTPELNRLDLLGQIEANRVVDGRINGLCDRYGSETVTAVLDGLIDRTEAAVRDRLASLPDGRWRHRGLVEHDGIDDRVYEIGLTMTKQGDSLHLDFTDASPQAPALINTSRAITSSYAMAAVMTVLGYGLPWTPAGFWRVMKVDTTPGTIVDCLWPAGMSMGVTAAGQEVRTAVNICLSRMFDASDDPDVRSQILASCVSGSFTQTISGAFEDGQEFSAMLLDGLPGGSGARWGGDGSDTGGYLTSRPDFAPTSRPTSSTTRCSTAIAGSEPTRAGPASGEAAWAWNTPTNSTGRPGQQLQRCSPTANSPPPPRACLAANPACSTPGCISVPTAQLKCHPPSK